jgi:hypothetical protein
MIKKLFVSTVAALAVINPVSAQVLTGDQDVDHTVEWKSPKWVAPKEVKENWVMVLTYKWPSYQVQYFGNYSTEGACEAARSSLSLDKNLVTTMCAVF